MHTKSSVTSEQFNVISRSTVTAGRISACSRTGELNNEEEIRDQQTHKLQHRYIFTFSH